VEVVKGLPKDLRTFLKDLSSTFPDQIKTVEMEIDPKFELTAAVERFEAVNQEPIVFFKKVKGSAMPRYSSLGRIIV
jgi:UbiD family decarboxylase